MQRTIRAETPAVEAAPAPEPRRLDDPRDAVRSMP
jgi:hypothetical protein